MILNETKSGKYGTQHFICKDGETFVSSKIKFSVEELP
jgi:hypothetical protein